MNMAANVSADVVASVLVVDDDPRVRDLIGDFLGQHGYRVEEASDAPSMDRMLAKEGPFDLIVLDVMMPGEDGLSVVRRLSGRGDGPAVIMLSAMGEETDRIVGLELGADDYVPKPCNPRELLARVRAVLRRRQDSTRGESKPHAIYRFEGWRFDPVQRMVISPRNVFTTLSNGEFLMLKALVDRPQQILGREELMDLVQSGGALVDGRAIDVQISRLRRKLEDSAGETLIRTFRSVGYMFLPSVTRE
jgi:two-component system OmpR family response regulator